MDRQSLPGGVAPPSGSASLANQRRLQCGWGSVAVGAFRTLSRLVLSHDMRRLSGT
jgi:hypothetical protein